MSDLGRRVLVRNRSRNVERVAPNDRACRVLQSRNQSRCANLILYGKGNPIDALDVIGGYVKNVHVKDGLYPASGEQLGREVLPGQGKVRCPEVIAALKNIGFDGDLIIEREISGEQRGRDIRQTIQDLNRWMGGGI